jgi:hypothetical protein
MAKIDLPTTLPTSYRFIASMSTFDYFKKDKLFSRDDVPAFNSKEERFVKLKMALPFLSSKKAEFSVGLARFEDRYYQSSVINFDDDKTIKVHIVYLVALSVLMAVLLMLVSIQLRDTKMHLLLKYIQVQKGLTLAHKLIQVVLIITKKIMHGCNFRT